MGKAISALTAVFLMISALSCSTMVHDVTNNLAKGVYQQNDIELLKEGAPAYLLIVESLICSDPDNRDYLMAGVQMFSSYAGVFVTDPARKKIFDDKVARWGNALLDTYPLYKKYEVIPATEKELKDTAFKNFVASIKKKDVPYVFWGIYTVGVRVLSDTSGPESFLYLPKIVAVAEKIYQLDDTFFNGMPHLFFGVYYGAYPEIYGGNPAKSKAEFEKAIELSGGKMLLYKVLFASVYYKNQYDREGFEKLLEEVIHFDVDAAPEFRLMNIMAQEQAKKLLSEIDDYFF